MERDLNDLYFAVLNYLSDYGIGVETNISSILRGYFLNIKVVEIEVYNSRVDHIIRILELIKNNAHIRYSNNQEINDITKIFYKEGNYSVSLTQQGLDYYYAHILRKATIQSLTKQLYYNFITWGIALLAVATTIYTIIQKSDQDQKLQLLNTEVQQLKSQQHSQVATHKIADTILKKK